MPEENRTQGATQMEVLRGPDGRAYVSADSLVDLFDDMAQIGNDDAFQSSVRQLADMFRTVSTYDEMSPTSDGSSVVARRCVCGTAVIDAPQLDGKTVTIDAEPVPDGEFFPIIVGAGKCTLAPWRPVLDGMDTVRLRRHECAKEGS